MFSVLFSFILSYKIFLLQEARRSSSANERKTPARSALSLSAATQLTVVVDVVVVNVDPPVDEEEEVQSAVSGPVQLMHVVA